MFKSRALVLVGLLAVGAGAAFFISRKTPAAQGGAITSPTLNFLTGMGQGLMSTVNNLSTPRGIRNNNPLNIKWNSIQVWDGQTGQDAQGFLIFDKPEMGIRAATRILTSYRNMGFVTPRQIISRWTGGDSAAIQNSYVAHISNGLGIPEGQEVPASRWFDLLKLMIKHENGQQPYTDNLIKLGISLA